MSNNMYVFESYMRLPRAIVYEWNHGGTPRRAKKQAPPPPNVRFGPGDFIFPEHLLPASELSRVKEEQSKIISKAEDENENKTHAVVDYNHGIDNPLDLDKFLQKERRKYLKNPLYRRQNNFPVQPNELKTSKKHIPSAPAVQASAKCPRTHSSSTEMKDQKLGDLLTSDQDDQSIQTKSESGLSYDVVKPVDDHQNIKEASNLGNVDLESLLGKKNSKGRVGVSSALYAKPLKKCKLLMMWFEGGFNFFFFSTTEVKELVGDKFHVTTVQPVHQTSIDKKCNDQAENTEEIIVDVCPYSILGMEEELRKMEEDDNNPTGEWKDSCTPEEPEQVQGGPEYAIAIRDDIYDM